jgi:hypothetical protein
MAKNVVSNEWKLVTRKMHIRRGHGTWIQVRIPQPGGGEKCFIMREVAKFRELGEVKEVSL